MLSERCHKAVEASKTKYLYVELFPLDRCGGLGGEIPEDAVDALDFGGDAADDLLEEGEVQLGRLGGTILVAIGVRIRTFTR